MRTVIGQLTRFILVGVANTGIGLFVIYGLMYFASIKWLLANICGYTAGLLVSFILNKNWSFADLNAGHGALPRFLLVFFVAYFANLGVIYASTAWLHINIYLAQLVAVVTYSALFFMGCRAFAFAPARTQPRQ